MQRRCASGCSCSCTQSPAGVVFRQVECQCHCLRCNASDDVLPFAALVPGVRCPRATCAAVRRPQASSGCPFSGAQQQSSNPTTVVECELKASLTPSARYGHTLTEFFCGHFLMLGGSRGASQCLNDVWILIPKRQMWIQLGDMVNVPSARFGHSCHLQADKNTLVFFGGCDASGVTCFNELHTLEFTSWGICRAFTCVHPNSPSDTRMMPIGRRSHTLVPYTNGRAVLFGGYNRVSLDDVWFLEPTLQWTRAVTTGASYNFGRYSHSAVIHNDQQYVFGGFGSNGVCNNTVWVLDLRTCVWRALETFGQAPCGRFGHSASLVGSKMVLFGGVDAFPSSESRNDCFSLNLLSREWTELCSGIDPAEEACEAAPVPSESINNFSLQGNPEVASSQQGATTAPVDGSSSRSLQWSDPGGGTFEDDPLDETDLVGSQPNDSFLQLNSSNLTTVTPQTQQTMLSSSTHVPPSRGAVTPIPRRSHTAVLDTSQSHAVVIFGGWNGGSDCDRMDSNCFHMILAPPTLKEMIRDQLIQFKEKRPQHDETQT